jgi:hypothetical protein
MPSDIWELCDNPSSFSNYNWDSDDLPARKFYSAITEIGRRLRHLMTDPGAVRMLELCEGCAEGRISEDDLSDVAPEFRASIRGENAAIDGANDLYWWVADRYKVNWEGVYPAAGAFAYLAALEAGLVAPQISNDEYQALSTHPLFASARLQTATEWGALIRDIYGPNPFHPVAFDPSWRTEAVVGLARGMYESRDFTPLPVLADALEDAGCAHPDILAHCRGPGPHVRGCWVVDLVLGKA